MKYGIYRNQLDNIVSYHCFEVMDEARAIRMGFEKIDEAETIEEARKKTPRWELLK